jgi:hypothetical protein
VHCDHPSDRGRVADFKERQWPSFQRALTEAVLAIRFRRQASLAVVSGELALERPCSTAGDLPSAIFLSVVGATYAAGHGDLDHRHGVDR